jgi:hypothetical protein
MSTREDLIRQNITRARAKPETPAPLERKGKEAEGTALAGRGSPRSFMGGNFDVYSKLESVDFEKGGGDGSMRGNTAFIQLWSRGGEASAASTTIPAGGLQDSGDYTQSLNKAIGEIVGDRESFTGTIESSSANNYAIIKSEDYQENEDGEIISGTRQTVFVPSNENKRQTNLSASIPGVPSPVVLGRGIVRGPSPISQNAFRPSPFLQSPTGLGPIPFFAPTNPIGTVVSANPNGLVNILTSAAYGAGLGALGFRQSFPSYLTGFRNPRPSNISQGSAPKVTNTVKPDGKMRWQFLFNPSELELDAGPEFKSAETWAVSDKANSGKPLHWTSNKNAELKFNSILLNGFVFGRKVEELEQGLIELFMARDGVGQHGPHVLEFVWGKRRFGPCVIKNINVKEKMWDEGQVVNAELSFTLEQVPEWTINDGAYVDIARPGRRPLQEEVANFNQAGTADAAGTTGETEQTAPANETSTPGSGQSSSQKPPTTSQTACTNIAVDIRSLQTLAGSYEASSKNDVEGGRLGSELGRTYQSEINQNVNSYSVTLQKYRNNSFYRDVINRLGAERPECVNPSVISNSFASSSRGKAITDIFKVKKERFTLYQSANLRLALCARNIETGMRQVSVNRGCPR